MYKYIYIYIYIGIYWPGISKLDYWNTGIFYNTRIFKQINKFKVSETKYNPHTLSLELMQ